MAKNAAALIIGNELLSGKIQEANIQFLGSELYSIGIKLEKVVFCLDEVDCIAEELNLLREKFSYVFTSGGVGPTHDDMTLDAVSKAFNVKMVRFPEVETLIRNFYKDKLKGSHLRMANGPEGAKLVSSKEVPWPTVRMENVFVLPGIPQIFRKKFSVILSLLTAGEPFYSIAVFINSDEGQIAELLSQLDSKFPEVQIGSYPNLDQLAFRVKVTFDGHQRHLVEAAKKEFENSVPKATIVDFS